MKKLFVVAGEISGDDHGCALLKALPPGEFHLLGLGGPAMNRESPGIEDWLDQAAVLGLWEVLKKYRYFKAKMEETLARIISEDPAGVILIDYPGFNLRLAQRLRDLGFGGKLIYYISPQVWAWKKGRVKTMAKLLDLMICIFPFEKQLYENSGLKTVFSGHPLLDSLAGMRQLPMTREPDLIALLPGSREREVRALFPPMLDAAEELLANRPDLRFITAGATAALSQRLSEMVRERSLEESVEVLSGKGHHVMKRAWAGVIASGTATLEAAILGLPYCLVYKVAWLTAFVARRVLKIPFLGIINVMANRPMVRELLQESATGPAIATELLRLLNDPEARAALVADMERTVATLGEGGAHQNAARAILSELSTA